MMGRIAAMQVENTLARSHSQTQLWIHLLGKRRQLCQIGSSWQRVFLEETTVTRYCIDTRLFSERDLVSNGLVLLRDAVE